MHRSSVLALALVLAASSMFGCGKASDVDSSPAPQDKSILSASAGQVAATGAGKVLTPYAAARVADQVSFGPTHSINCGTRLQGPGILDH